MSGPTTAVYETTAPLLTDAAIANLAGLSAVVLAARTIREAQAIHQEYGEVQQRVIERTREQIAQRGALRQAQQNRLTHLHTQAQQLQAKWERMQALLPAATTLDLAAPVGENEGEWLTYLAALRQALQQLERELPQANTTTILLAEQPDTAQLLAAYAQQRAQQSQLTTEQIAHYQALSLHLLARLALPQGAPLPVRIESLARELLQAYDVTRAEALAADLRREIQYANQQHVKQQADSTLATAWLQQLGDALPAELLSRLQAVAAGVRLLDEATRTAAQAVLTAVEAARQREEQEAVAVVLEQSLRDLGYDVEDIAETLFVSGGMVHFQKAAWDDYHVRMRVNPATKTVNFNVVRAQGERDARQDFVAEDRWCSEFPTLLKTLAARGVKLNVTRLLQAGEVPVQQVDPATLPVAKTEEERYQTTAAKEMKW